MAKIVNAYKFNSDLKLFAKKLDIDLSIVVRKVSIQILNGVIEKTPVATGTARGGWLVGINTAASDPGSYTPNSGALSDGISKLAILPPRVVKVIISNYVPYIRELEGGSSSQAPEGMVSRTLTSVSSALGKVL